LITVNGVARELDHDSTVEAVVREVTTPRAGLAVARNGEVVPRAEWERTRLADGDRVEILAATAGG
jgi:sulfur carrier protein